MNELKLKEMYIAVHGFKKVHGWAIKAEELSQGHDDEMFYAGKSLRTAIYDYVRRATWYAEDNSEDVFEDIDDAVDYVDSCNEDNNDFEHFKQSQLPNIAKGGK